jgi:hypothetical protein
MFDYRMRDLDQWVPHLSGTWRYIADQYSSLLTLPPVGLIPDHPWADFNLHMIKSHYELSLYAKYLFDKRAFNGASPGTNNTTGAMSLGGPPIQPRTIGFSATITI